MSNLSELSNSNLGGLKNNSLLNTRKFQVKNLHLNCLIFREGYLNLSLALDIRKYVMNELQNANHQGINYNACLLDDNKTFIHTAFFKSEEDQKLLNDLSSFKVFQEQLKSGGLEIPPKQELLTLIGTSPEIF